MNYRHHYHAGSFTDVFKHLVLMTLIKSLLRKDKPFFYLDTHAGAGCYDLFSEEYKKNEEHELGIGKLLQQKNPPDLVRQYLNCIRRINNRLTDSVISSLRYYPGSPFIVHYFLRAQDRMTLTELHPQEYQLLKNHFAAFKNQNVTLYLSDGYQGLKTFLPPKERRGLILIDPPYERPNEFSYLAAAIPLALKRFATGTYAIWYPIKDRHSVDHFHRTITEAMDYPMLAAEFSLYPDDNAMHLNGCGIIIINPPWQCREQIMEYLPWLWKALSIHGQGQYRVVKWPL